MTAGGEAGGSSYTEVEGEGGEFCGGLGGEEGGHVF